SGDPPPIRPSRDLAHAEGPLIPATFPCPGLHAPVGWDGQVIMVESTASCQMMPLISRPEPSGPPDDITSTSEPPGGRPRGDQDPLRGLRGEPAPQYCAQHATAGFRTDGAATPGRDSLGWLEGNGMNSVLRAPATRRPRPRRGPRTSLQQRL